MTFDDEEKKHLVTGKAGFAKRPLSILFVLEKNGEGERQTPGSGPGVCGRLGGGGRAQSVAAAPPPGAPAATGAALRRGPDRRGGGGRRGGEAEKKIPVFFPGSVPFPPVREDEIQYGEVGGAGKFEQGMR